VTGDLRGWLDAASGSDEDFVDRAWRLVVRRPPEDDGRELALAKLRDGTLSRAGLLRQLVESEEFGRVDVLDAALAFAAAERAKPREASGPARPRLLQAPATVDERPIEIPWCLARYRDEQAVLDAGYAFAEPSYLAALSGLGAERLVGVDLATAEVPGLEPVQADLRELPFRDGEFDVVFCISTIEHVGQDNDRYGIEPERGGMERALRELRRVGKRVLITVPTGESGDHGWFIQLDPERWLDLFRSTGFIVFEHELYELSDEGWRSAPEFRADGVVYGSRGPGASAVLCAELLPRTAGAVLRGQLRRLRGRSTT
jgi:SAM-dependent methyltransferase